jgi:hypothetical protein
MNSYLLIYTLPVALPGIVCAADVLHTPEIGSPERQMICDAARPYVLKEYGFSKKPPQPILFKVRRMVVLRDYCSFEAVPVFKDGSVVGTDYIMDIVFNLCLKKTDGTWKVIYDLSSTDVPSDAELAQMWRDFPKAFPTSLIPEFWREHFSRLK